MKYLIMAALAAFCTLGSVPAKAETTECTVLTTLPVTINVQGVYCLKGNLVTAITTGNAITINTNNVTIDLNGWKLGGSAAGVSTVANGIFAENRKNIILRNGAVRGFFRGIFIGDLNSTSAGHIVEDILADGNRYSGIWVEGDNSTIRNNKVTNTGPHGIETNVFAIYTINGTGTTIIGNVVSGVEETFIAHGIYVGVSSDVEVRNNQVFDLKSAPNKYGITVDVVSRVVLKDNTVATGNGGSIGIGESFISENVACINNQVSGFTNNYAGCDTSFGNLSY